MDENDVILASIGNVINGKLIVDKGPLKGQESRVKRLERHDRWADIELPLFGECDTMRVGLEVVARITKEK